jgi:diacylglycerol kinase (ATP)
VAWTAIVNPAAGRGRARKRLPALRDALTAPGLDVDVVVSTGPDDPARIARAAFAAGRGVVACGGDGLVAELAGIAAETEGLLAVVPLGAGNDFARTLGLEHRNPLAAVQLLRDGKEMLVDLGRADGHWFTSVANTGFDAEANRWANGVTHLSGTTLYVVAVVRTLAVYEPQQFRLTLDDGEPRDVRAWLIAFANGDSYAGGMHIAPNARLDDGTLDITIVGPVSRPGFLRTFPRVFRGTHVTHPAVTCLRSTTVSVESLEADSGMEIYASGERVGPLPARVEAVPAALRVLVPADQFRSSGDPVARERVVARPGWVHRRRRPGPRSR